MADENLGDSVTVVHTGVGVLLMSYDLDPGSINPDFLRYNGIAGADWTVEAPVTVEPGSSRVVYDNGVVVTASRDHVSFLHTGESLGLDDFVSPAMAMRYLSMVAPRSGYEVVAVDPRGLIRLPVGGAGVPGTVLGALGRRLPFGEELPSVQVRVSYELNGRDITLYVGEALDETSGRVYELRFSAHIHHDVPRSEPVEQTAFVRSVLGVLAGRRRRLRPAGGTVLF